ncbi:hypothetical protein [Paraburkholderia hayleyella]|uniref:hypothetical protein n=1 Tax=Paraburkholderia hayleyella TaxID=2152889 RepID=UPI0012910858|nr:hypothetical protein [Paraburkholderia hayleyella]
MYNLATGQYSPLRGPTPTSSPKISETTPLNQTPPKTYSIVIQSNDPKTVSPPFPPTETNISFEIKTLSLVEETHLQNINSPDPQDIYPPSEPCTVAENISAVSFLKKTAPIMIGVTALTAGSLCLRSCPLPDSDNDSPSCSKKTFVPIILCMALGFFSIIFGLTRLFSQRKNHDALPAAISPSENAFAPDKPEFHFPPKSAPIDIPGRSRDEEYDYDDVSDVSDVSPDLSSGAI